MNSTTDDSDGEYFSCKQQCKCSIVVNNNEALDRGSNLSTDKVSSNDMLNGSAEHKFVKVSGVWVALSLLQLLYDGMGYLGNNLFMGVILEAVAMPM